MKKTAIKNDIKALLQAEGVEVFGYCSALPFEQLRLPYLTRQLKDESCPLEQRDPIEDLIDPVRQLAHAQSFLVILESHSPYVYEDTSLSGRMATGTASEDYHHILHEKLQKIGKFLSDKYAVNSQVIVDTSPLSDRAIAIRAGLGIIRRNNMFYHKKYGSYVHIGSLLMDIDLHDKDYLIANDPCGPCRKCVVHCPGQAIIGDGTINSNACVSYLTQKKTLSQKEASTIGRMIYGCDVCQQICPANRGVKNEQPDLLLTTTIECKDILYMNQQTFKETFKKSASGWRGKRTLQRNAIAVLKNIGTEDSMALIQTFKTESPLLKEAVDAALADDDHAR